VDAGFLSLNLAASFATHSMSADPYKQQIPPLRCAPVGMMNRSITSILQRWVLRDDAFAGAALDLVLELYRRAVV
jgi:hypothetical protein